MGPDEHDVYLCYRRDGDEGMVSEVAAGLARLGFRVSVPGRESAGDRGSSRLNAIEKAPDFVLLSAPAPVGPAAGNVDPRAADLAHAFKTRRNILVLADPAHDDPLASADLPGRPRLAAWQRVAYDPKRPRESIALVAHRLFSSSDVEDRRLMSFVTRAAIAVALMLAVAVALRAVPAAVKWWNRPQAPPPLPRYVLYWSAFGQRVQDGQWTAFAVTDGSAVAAGDQIRLAFSPGSDGYAYVLIRDAHGGISPLYPNVTLRGASRVRAGSVYQVPGDDRGWPLAPQAGLATIYIFAGHEPLENLEELLEEPESGVNPAARLELLTSTLAGLLDGRHGTAPRPIRTRGGREILDSLSPAPPPGRWPATPGGGSAVGSRPETQIGLLSAVVEIRLKTAPPD